MKTTRPDNITSLFIFLLIQPKQAFNKANANILISSPAFKSRWNSFPVWLKDLYEMDSDEFLNDAIPEIIYFKRISDSISYCLYEVSDGVCLITFVATQKNKKHYKKLRIGRSM
jgi:hypothetical protein